MNFGGVHTFCVDSGYLASCIFCQKKEKKKKEKVLIAD